MKRCSACGLTKPKDSFHKDRSKSTGLTSKCKDCSAIRAKQWRQENRENWLFQGYKGSIKHKYGITYEELVSKIESQLCACAIRGEDISEDWHIDHDHSTGKVRGILCPSCNKGLAFFRDNPAYLEQAIQYLRSSNGSTTSVE